MVMIRPVLRANAGRIRKVHIICFFIFLVSNLGGALSPMGDPPLFLGFLHNVPFLGLVSLRITPRQNREINEFSWTPIVEVAKLFAAIFITIIPAILILKAGDKGALAGLLAAISRPSHYFWVVGGLSSFLDNAPTYLTFFNMGLGKLGIEEAAVAAACTATNPLCNQEWIGILTAVSAGSVFMGANTYIGNAPNFMVKSIAEEAGVNMPSFFGYIIKYSLPFLIPVFILNTVLFF